MNHWTWFNAEIVDSTMQNRCSVKHSAKKALGKVYHVNMVPSAGNGELKQNNRKAKLMNQFMEQFIGAVEVVNRQRCFVIGRYTVPGIAAMM